MRRFVITTIVVLLVLLMSSCANPAANKPKATVSNAAPEGDSAKPANAERLTISPDNSKDEYVADKATRSHNGSLKQFAAPIDLANNAIENSHVTIDIQTH